jgi:hypothetical protein
MSSSLVFVHPTKSPLLYASFTRFAFLGNAIHALWALITYHWLARRRWYAVVIEVVVIDVDIVVVLA